MSVAAYANVFINRPNLSRQNEVIKGIMNPLYALTSRLTLYYVMARHRAENPRVTVLGMMDIFEGLCFGEDKRIMEMTKHGRSD